MAAKAKTVRSDPAEPASNTGETRRPNEKRSAQPKERRQLQTKNKLID